jgi:hypothetical protein
MAKLFLNVLRMRSLLDQLRGEGMPEIMEANLSQLCTPGTLLKRPDQVALI